MTVHLYMYTYIIIIIDTTVSTVQYSTVHLYVHVFKHNLVERLNYVISLVNRKFDYIVFDEHRRSILQ